MDGEITLSSLPCVCVCAERAQATEQRYNKLKEKHTELVASHAELLRKVQAHCRSGRGCLLLTRVSAPHRACYCVDVVPTECRHCEDAVRNPADPGRSGEDQTAAVV